jgi:hypothetical protein
MARSQRTCILFCVLAAAVLFRSTVFVPPPTSVKSSRTAQVSTAACAAALLSLAENARADEIGDAAEKLTKATYPFMREVPWYSTLYSVNPGKEDAVGWAKAIGKMIDMGASMDMNLLKAGAAAHHAGILGSDVNGVCSQSQLTNIYAALGRMIASVPEAKTMDVYNTISGLVDPKVPAYLMSTVKEEDAKAAYNALVDFAGVVKAHPITPSAPSSTLPKVAQVVINAGASQLSAASYPFIKDVDWTSSLYSKPIPGQDPKMVMRAIDKMIVMGSEMDGAALKEAALAHAKAINGVDAKGVLSQGDFEAINAGLGKAIASVPTSKAMDVYNAMAALVGESPVPDYLYSKVNPQNAQAAYNALLEFKDIVKAAKSL